MIRLWYCAECGPPTYWNSYTRAADLGCVYLHGPLARVEMTPEQAAKVVAKLLPETVAMIAKEQGVAP